MKKASLMIGAEAPVGEVDTLSELLENQIIQYPYRSFIEINSVGKSRSILFSSLWMRAQAEVVSLT